MPLIAELISDTMKSISPRKIVAASMAAIFIYVFAIIAIYWHHLGALPASTASPEPWGQFGDYVGGLLNPLFAFLNVAAVVYIAFAVQRFGESQRKAEQESERRLQTVIDLHREWNSGSIYSSRTIAGKLIREYPDLTIFEIEEQAPSERAAHIWVVIGFFQRLSFLVENDRLHKKMTLELFAELFVWWWVLCFEKQLAPCECDARDRMLTLKTWIYENTSCQQRAPWEHRASKDLAEAVQSANTPPLMVLE